MSWEILTTEDVLNEFTLPEASALRNLQGSGSGSGPPFTNLDEIVARVIDTVRGYILAGGYAVDPTFDNTLPLGLFQDAISIARWKVLISSPMLKQLQTEERKLAYEEALKKLQLIADQKFAPEPIPGDTTSRGGNWNSECKLIMRTHPVPQPDNQWPALPTDWANVGPQPPSPVAGAIYDPSIVALRDDPHSLEALATTRYATSQLLIIVIADSQSGWQLDVGPADIDNPDGEVQPLDYDAGTNNRHWTKVGGL